MIRFCLAALAALLLAGAEDATLVVTVQDEAGRPIADAHVTVWSDEHQTWDSTDARGQSRLPDLEPGVVTVLVTAEGRVGSLKDGVRLPEGGVVELEYRLAPGVPFHGRVVDVDDEPVRDAFVDVFSGPDPIDRFMADRDGRFRVRGIPGDGVATILVRAPGFLEGRFPMKPVGDVEPPDPVVLRLEDDSTVEGVVRDPEGRPVANARVYVKWSDGKTVRTSSTRTDEKGDFRLRRIDLDVDYVAWAEAQGFERSGESPVFRATGDRPVVRVELTLSEPGDLRLRIVDDEGCPVVDAHVRVGGRMRGIEKERSGFPGVYDFRGLPPGEPELTIEHPGFLAVHRTVEVRGGETERIRIVLDPGVVVAGVLTDEAGRPAAGKTVVAEQWKEKSNGWREFVSKEDETDEAGRFRISLPQAGKCEVRVRNPGFDLPEKVEVEAPIEDLKLAGRSLGVVWLTLKTPDGRPLPDRVFVWQHRKGSATGGSEEHEDGRMVFLGFEGWGRLRIQVEGYVEIDRELTVPPGESRDLGEIVLDPGVTLTGRVTDLAGAPVAGALVEHSDYTEATTDAEGRFALPHVPAGRIRVTVDAEGFLGFEAAAVAGRFAPAAVLALPRGTLVRGVLRDPEGEALSDHWVQIRAPVGEDEWRERDFFSTEEDGSFEFRAPAGPCRLVFVKERGAMPVVLAEMVLREGGTRSLDLELPR